jgi:hypothetical protein
MTWGIPSTKKPPRRTAVAGGDRSGDALKRQQTLLGGQRGGSQIELAHRPARSDMESLMKSPLKRADGDSLQADDFG